MLFPGPGLTTVVLRFRTRRRCAQGEWFPRHGTDAASGHGCGAPDPIDADIRYAVGAESASRIGTDICAIAQGVADTI